MADKQRKHSDESLSQYEFFVERSPSDAEKRIKNKKYYASLERKMTEGSSKPVLVEAPLLQFLNEERYPEAVQQIELEKLEKERAAADKVEVTTKKKKKSYKGFIIVGTLLFFAIVGLAGFATLSQQADSNNSFVASAPSVSPTNVPTNSPTTPSPTSSPTTSSPTFSPSRAPTQYPTTPFPTFFPSKVPTPFPTSYPTDHPTPFPTTAYPTTYPSDSPTPFPTSYPTDHPTPFPTTAYPTSFPTESPTAFPTTFPVSSDPEPIT